MKTAVIYHSIDLDGWMSAAIVKHWWIKNNPPLKSCILKEKEDSKQYNPYKLNELSFIGYNYGQPIPDLSGYDKVIMCDISFPKEEMIILTGEYKERFIWIDHHISIIKDMDGMKTGGLRDTKFAACELTWFYFFPNEPTPEIVRLLGLYDSFRHKGTDEETKVLEFQYGARQVIWNYETAYDRLLETIKFEKALLDIHLSGASIYSYLCTEAVQTYKNGFEIELSYPIKNIEVGMDKIPGKNTTIFEVQVAPFKFICINKERFNPINFGIDYHKDGYDGAACFHYANGMWNFSIYNDNGLVDCSVIAKQYGGGGHFSAAGMILNTTDFLKLING